MRRLFILLLMPLITLTGFAQGTSVGQEINNIKRSGQYFYQEATMPTEDEARQAANLLLAAFITTYLRDHNMAAEQVTPDNLRDVQYKMMPRGSQVRVFAYVPHSNYLSIDATPAKKSVANQAPAKTETPRTAEPESPAPMTKPQPQAQPVAQPREEAQPVAQAREEEQPAITDAGQLSQRQQHALAKLLNSEDLYAALKLLEMQKSQSIVADYGTITDCKEPDKCYWIIADKNMKIVTMLGPGSNARRNFGQGGESTLSDFPGYNAVWFKLIK